MSKSSNVIEFPKRAETAEEANEKILLAYFAELFKMRWCSSTTQAEQASREVVNELKKEGWLNLEDS